MQSRNGAWTQARPPPGAADALPWQSRDAGDNKTNGKLAIGIAIIAAVLVSIPAISGYFSQPPGYAFTGFDWQDDFHLYASYIKQASEQPRILMENRFTTEPQAGVYVFLYFSLLGAIGWLTGISVPMVFLIGRFFVVIAFLLILWKALGNFFSRESERLVSFLIITFGGGLGWLVIAFGLLDQGLLRLRSHDINYSLGYSTFGQLTFPLPYIAYALFLLIFICLKKHSETRDVKFIIVAVAMHALIFFVHPASIAVFSLALALLPLATFFTEKSVAKAIAQVKTLLPFLASSALVLAYIFFAMHDFAYSESFKAYMAWERGEPLPFFLVGYGLLIPLALFGLRKLEIKSNFAKAFLLAWVAGAFIAAINPQKGVKLMFALHVPIATLASFGLFRLCNALSEKWKTPQRLIVAGAVVLLCLSAPFILANKASDVQNPQFQSGPYISEADFSAMKFLAKEAKGNVLSSYKTGNNLPYIAPDKVFLGHWTETAHYKEKQEKVAKFYSEGASIEFKRALISENAIRYVFYGENEKKLGSVDPRLELEEIYNSGGTIIYLAKKA